MTTKTDESLVELRKVLEKKCAVQSVSDGGEVGAKSLTLFDHFDQIDDVKDKRVRYEGRIVKLTEMKNHLFAHVYMRSSDLLQCYIARKIEGADSLTEGCTVMLVGKICSVPPKHSAPGDIEMTVDSLVIIGTCPAGGVSTVVQVDSIKDHLLNTRHLSLRYPQYSVWIYAEHIVAQAFRDFFLSKKMIEVFPPTITKTKAEGGSEVFEVQYFKTKAYLTQSSQMYLEALVPSVGDCFCVLPSFRAEPSQTYRHLAEYTHIEAEMQFFTLSDLMDFIEDLIRAVDRAMHLSGAIDKIRRYNPSAKINTISEEPFLRITYKEYVDMLRKFEITEEGTGRYYECTEDIPSLPEKKFINKVQKPTFIYGIPRHLKAFYMKPMDTDDTLADCCDLLLPGIGEVFGASVRMHDLQKLKEAHIKMAALDQPNLTEEQVAQGKEILESMKFYEDLRQYGGHYTAGFGAGLSRMLLFYGCEDIKLATPFPRTIVRLEP